MRSESLIMSISDKYCYTATVNVNLGPALDRFVAELLKTGLYQSQSEVLREGLRMLKGREDLRKAQLAELRGQIALGIAEADRGEFVDGLSAFTKIRRRAKKPKRAAG